MAVVIRLKRAGAKKRPFYRIVTADSRRQRDGRFIEILGHYDPLAKPHRVVIDQERVAHWIANGARPSVQVASLLRSSGMKPATVGPAVSAAPTPSAGSTKKKAAKRRVPRPRSARKTRQQTARKKSAGAPAAPKAAKKK